MTRVHIEIDMALTTRLGMAAAERGVRAATIEAEGILKKDILNRLGTGRIYRSGKSKTHQASAPGEPPAPDNGDLRRSVTTEVVRGPSEVIGIVAVNMEYAAALELGTERMAARPFLSRLARDYRDRLQQVFNKFGRI